VGKIKSSESEHERMNMLIAMGVSKTGKFWSG